MAVNHWEAQRTARQRTAFFLVLFVAMTLCIAAGAEWALRYFAGANYNPPYPYFGLAFLGITFLTTGYQYFSYSLYGGSAVAQAVGGRPVRANTTNFQEKQLLNIVEELCIASQIPQPAIFIIPCKQINAFAAGLTRDKAAVAITQGALERLNRDEIQGVLAHELGHISNNDMRVGTSLAAMVMGFFIILYIGLRLLEGSFWAGAGSRSSGNSNSGGGQNSGQLIALMGLIFIVAGSITWIAGSILKSMISKEREYLADASAVQFTRNPAGLIGALHKIAAATDKDLPRSSFAYAHLYFDDRTFIDSLFGTHPPLEKRIAVLEGSIKR